MTETSTVILVGAGHAHLYIASRAAAYKARGVRLLLIDPGNFWYSGLATGVLSGMYSAEADQIDAQALVESAGGQFIRDRVTAIDTITQTLTLDSGEILEYDRLSLNIGSEITAGDIVNEDHLCWWPVKPIPNLYEFRRAIDQAIFRTEHMPAVCIIGGGATGSEICANLLGLAKQHGVAPNITLITGSERLLTNAPRGAARALQRNLEKRGARLLFGERITGSDTGVLVTDRGSRIDCSHALLAPGLQAHQLTRRFGVAAGDEGIKVNCYMQSVDSPTLFAAGDCADFLPRKLPKLGIFGVRAARIVHHNLLASLQAKPLRPYRPQRVWLTILNLGNGEGLALWWRLWWLGRRSLWLKDRIDRQFLQQYRGYYQ